MLRIDLIFLSRTYGCSLRHRKYRNILLFEEEFDRECFYQISKAPTKRSPWVMTQVACLESAILKNLRMETSKIVCKYFVMLEYSEAFMDSARLHKPAVSLYMHRSFLPLVLPNDRCHMTFIKVKQMSNVRLAMAVEGIIINIF